jgi:4a-hydroxytetrahydrobiopterin dehydratase
LLLNNRRVAIISNKMENAVQKQWEEINDRLYKIIIFKDFQEAFAFMSKVATLAEREGHHPKWCNEYNKLEIWLSTHDAGNVVTDKDRNMAKLIDAILD